MWRELLRPVRPKTFEPLPTPRCRAIGAADATCATSAEASVVRENARRPQARPKTDLVAFVQLASLRPPPPEGIDVVRSANRRPRSSPEGSDRFLRISTAPLPRPKAGRSLLSMRRFQWNFRRSSAFLTTALASPAPCPKTRSDDTFATLPASPPVTESPASRPCSSWFPLPRCRDALVYRGRPPLHSVDQREPKPVLPGPRHPERCCDVSTRSPISDARGHLRFADRDLVELLANEFSTRSGQCRSWLGE